MATHKSEGYIGAPGPMAGRDGMVTLTGYIRLAIANRGAFAR